MKTGIVTGSFDLLHAGHLHLFREAKKHCDNLIVALHVDPSIERPNKNKPIESIWERIIKLRACREVDQVTIYEREEELENLFKFHNIDIRFLGSDYVKIDPYNPPKITAEEALPIIYIDSLSIHTSEIRERVKKS